MDREVIDKWCERTILGLVLGILIFGPLALGGVRMSEFVVMEWLVVALLVVWLVRIWVKPRFRLLLPPAAWSVLPLVVYAVWRYRTSDIEYLARQEFIQVIMAAVIFFAIVSNLYGQTELRTVTVCLVALGTLVAMYGIYQWLTGSQKVWHFARPGYEGRGSGTYICPNHLAGFLEMICPLALALTVLRGFGAVPRIFFAYASFVMLVGIAATGSRGGWLSTGAAIAGLGLILIRKRTHIWAALALLLVVGSTGTWLYTHILEPRLYQRPGGKEPDDIRLRLWDSAKHMWKDHPWFGVGPAHFDYRYRGYRRAHWEVQPRPGYAHNDYWNTLADWGLVGLTLVLVPVLVTGLGAIRSWRYLHRGDESPGSRAALVLGSCVGLVAILVHSFFDFNMHIPANAFLAVVLLAIVAAHTRFASQKYWVTARWPISVALTLILAGTGYYLAKQAKTLTAEVMALHRAHRAPIASNERVSALQDAFLIESRNSETASAIGEQLRLRSWAGQEAYQVPGLEAVTWFKRSMELNPWDPRSCVGAGMCLDWVGQHAEAEPYFRKAVQLDPNHWYTRAMMGWHYFQVDDFTETCRWMESSLQVEGARNTLATTYLALAKKQLAEQTSEKPPIQFPRSIP